VQSTQQWLLTYGGAAVLTALAGLNIWQGDYWFAAGAICLALASILYQRNQHTPLPLLWQRITNALTVLGFGVMVLSLFGALP
jgi:hypothetical protein